MKYLRGVFPYIKTVLYVKVLLPSLCDFIKKYKVYFSSYRYPFHAKKSCRTLSINKFLPERLSHIKGNVNVSYFGLNNSLIDIILWVSLDGVSLLWVYGFCKMLEMFETFTRYILRYNWVHQISSCYHFGVKGKWCWPFVRSIMLNWVAWYVYLSLKTR